jgi:hypothetical protein
MMYHDTLCSLSFNMARDVMQETGRGDGSLEDDGDEDMADG